MIGRLPISLVSALVWGQVVKSAPADPIITSPAILPRQNADNFIGWLSYAGAWVSQTCASGGTWYQNGDYAQCCATSLPSCYAPTACVSGSLIYPMPDQSTTSTIPCSEGYSISGMTLCNTVFIFENTDDSSPQTDIICGVSPVNWSYYRSIDPSLTESPTTTAPSRSTSLSSQTTSETPTGTASSAPAPKKESKAWIAGAVVGPILGLALVGFLIFFLLRRRKNKRTPETGTVTAPPGYSDAKPVANGQGGYNPQDPYSPYGQSPAHEYSDPYQSAFAPGHENAHQPVGQMGSPVELGDSQIAEMGKGGSHTVELSGEKTEN